MLIKTYLIDTLQWQKIIIKNESTIKWNNDSRFSDFFAIVYFHESTGVLTVKTTPSCFIISQKNLLCNKIYPCYMVGLFVEVSGFCFSPMGGKADLAGTAIASQPVSRAGQANYDSSSKNQGDNRLTIVEVPAVTLRRTDTTLDLTKAGSDIYGAVYRICGLRSYWRYGAPRNGYLWSRPRIGEQVQWFRGLILSVIALIVVITLVIVS